MYRLKPLAESALHSLGFFTALRHWNRSGLRILMYHNFPQDAAAQESFSRQCAHIRKNYCPISLDEVADCLHSGKTLPSYSVAITVDDGYRDFYTTGFPILRDHQLHATVYLMTGFLDRELWPWWDVVEYLIEHASASSLSLQTQSVTLRLKLSSAEDKRMAAEALMGTMKTVPNGVRRQILQDLPNLLGCSLPSTVPDRLAPMNWDEVRELSKHGVCFGAHTRTHPIMSRVESEDELRDEVEHSRDRIAAELGLVPRHFCYPNGRPEDIGDVARRVVAQSGFETAVTVNAGLNVSYSDALLLQRIGVEPDYPDVYFCRLLAGHGLR
jgi:peptidoglycan/xylan/chitin deacetylase (PgdA/CDA1 family)